MLVVEASPSDLAVGGWLLAVGWDFERRLLIPESVVNLFRYSIGVPMKKVIIAKLKIEITKYFAKLLFANFCLNSLRFLTIKNPKKTKSPMPSPTKLDWERVQSKARK